MNKAILDELEFEKNKREILKQSSASKSNTVQVTGERKYAWEIELEAYKKSKRLEKFHTVGAVLGILAFIEMIISNFDKIVAFLMKL